MRIGVLGLGSIGSRHARNLRDMGHEVIGYDPAVTPMGRWREEAIGTDAVVIATPTADHFFDLMSCIEAGKPTFVEKPIAATHEQWCQLQNYESTKRLFVGFNLRFHHCVIQAKKWIGEDMIGTPLWASFTCAQFNDKPAYLRDGVIFNWSHEIDLALYLLGPAKVASAAARTTGGCDDIADIVLKHESGAQSTVHLDYVTKREQRYFRIAGDRGLITITLVQRAGNLAIWASEECRSFQAHDSFDSNYVDEMAAFIDRIEGKDVPGATGEDGLAALDICLQARRLAGLQ